MQLSKYRSTWLDISCNFQNKVQPLEICNATQDWCTTFGNMYYDLRKVMGTLQGRAFLVGKVTGIGGTVIYFTLRHEDAMPVIS